MDSRLRGNDKMKRQAELRTAQGEGAVEITTSGFALLVMTMVGQAPRYEFLCDDIKYKKSPIARAQGFC